MPTLLWPRRRVGVLGPPPPPPPPLPYDLADAIYQCLAASAAAALATGGFHAGYAGPGIADPYVELTFTDGPRIYDSSGTYVASGHLQANHYAPSRRLAARLADTVEATLAAAVLTFQAGYLLSLRSSDGSWSKDPDPGFAGDTVYEDVRMFAYVMSR